MIDSLARQEAIKLVLRLKSRELSVSDFEKNWPMKSRDIGVRSIGFWIWTLFSDDDNGVVKYPENDQFRKIIENSISFLSSQKEFTPRRKGLKNKIESFLTSGVEWIGCELPWHDKWPDVP